MKKFPNFDPILNSFNPRLKAGFHGDAVGTPLTWLLDDEIAEQYGKSGIQSLIDEPVTLDRLSNHSAQCILTELGLNDAFKISNNPTDQLIIESVHLRYLRWAKAHQYSASSKPEIQYQDALETWLHTKTLEFSDSCLFTLLEQEIVGQKATNDYATNCAMTRMAPIGIRFSDDPVRAFELGRKVSALTLGSSEAQFASAAFAMLIALLEQGSSLKSAVEAILQRLYENPESRPVYDQIIDPSLMEFKLVVDQFNDFDWPFGYGWGAVEALSLSINIAMSDCSKVEKLIKAVSHNGDSAALAVLVCQI